jgi:short-subunit dehydrogenase
MADATDGIGKQTALELAQKGYEKVENPRAGNRFNFDLSEFF